MKMKKLLLVSFPIIAFVLELLPYGVVLNFANPEGEPWRRTYSYFSLTPFWICKLWSFHYCHTDLRPACIGSHLSVQTTQGTENGYPECIRLCNRSIPYAVDVRF